MEETNTIVTQDKKMEALVNPEYTGGTLGSASKFPPVINVLQSDKQYKAFGDAGLDLTMRSHGKLFVRRQEGNTLEDLVDSIEGVVLKIEQGHEVRQFDEESGTDKILDSKPYMITGNNKQRWLDQNPGKKFKNMVKVVLAPLKPLEEIKADMKAGVNPFMMLSIKGASWGSWFEAQREMNAVAMASKVYGHKRADDLLVSVFKFTITSQLKKSDSPSYPDYYVPVINVSLNDPDTAFDYSVFVDEMKELSLFFNVAQDIADRQANTGYRDSLEDQRPNIDNTEAVEGALGIPTAEVQKVEVAKPKTQSTLSESAALLN